ncbi:MAG TPA: protein kinase, partial [Minicystis sp.]|nr:protein kinase [Minicystis sp.]
DVSLDRPVAIKILPDELAREPGAIDRFVREARAQARLHSPHVVQIFFIGDVREESGASSLYFAMERVAGGSLEDRLERGERLAPERARRLLLQAVRGLDDANEAGIVHRDIKPANLLLDASGDLKIADFGLAKPRDPKLSLTRQGTILGTPHYMAPEQALGMELDLRADMYSLGCTFYHLMAGGPPFDAPTPVAMFAKHLHEPPRPIRDVAPEVPPALAAVVDRLLAKDREQRYPSYAALREALEAAAPERVEYATLGARAAAMLVDAVLLSLLVATLGWPGLVLHVALITAGLALFGQTPGKYLMRVKVTTKDGGRVGPFRALGRVLASMWLPFGLMAYALWSTGLPGFKDSVMVLTGPVGLSAEVLIVASNGLLALLFAAGYAVAAANRQRRAAHDFAAGTVVVHRRGR